MEEFERIKIETEDIIKFNQGRMGITKIWKNQIRKSLM